jgi:hypothetical protein
LCAVTDIGGYAPGIAGASIVLCISNFEQNMAFHKIAGLFEWVVVFRQNIVFSKKKFSHKSPAAVTKCLLPDTLKGIFVAVFIVFAKYHSLRLKQ